MTTRICPNWPALLEIAPDLRFAHYALGEARLPAEALGDLPAVPLEAVAICADLEHNVFNGAHTDRRVAAAIADADWQDVHAWAERGRGRRVL